MRKTYGVTFIKREAAEPNLYTDFEEDVKSLDMNF